MNILKQWVGGVAGGSFWESMKAFAAGTFDFVNNLWTDVSGNGNHISLRNASARTGNGGNLDYTITGLLTSDTVNVVSGSATPTIPSNGILRIGSAQVVYGVTIRRSSVVWAVIPFCEPYMNENIPTISYDVSGNGHHATCATLASGNITTQNNYFYLQQYGYSLRAQDLLGWNTGSWTGDKATYTAIFAGVALSDTQNANRYLEPTPDGLGCRFTRNSSVFQFAELSILTVGKRYRLVIDFQTISSTTGFPGHVCNTLGLSAASKKWWISTERQVIDLNGVANAANFFISVSNTAGVEVNDLYNPRCYLMVVVPALMTGTLDALGNTIEFVPDGSTLLNYTCQLELPAALITADQKGCWSDYMNEGYCVNGKTYLIEKTTANHFGSGKIVFNEFVSNGTEELNDDNVVRELMLNGTQRGFFFDDNTTPHLRSFSELKNILTHFCYLDREKLEKYHYFDNVTYGLYPLNMYDNVNVNGWKEYQDTNKIANLTILKSDVYLADFQKIIANARYKRIEEPSFAMMTFVYDSLTEQNYAACLAVFTARNLKITRAAYFGDNLTKATTDALLAAGNEVVAHTPTWNGELLPGYKGFWDDEGNYTQEQLAQYYSEIKAWAIQNGYYEGARILPGGQQSLIAMAEAMNYFKASFMASGSDRINRIPIVKYENVGRAAREFLDATEVTAIEADVDTAISIKGWTVFYSHAYSHNANTLTNQGIVFDYIRTKQNAGDMIRFCKLEDAYTILKKIR
jgi:hypothetical protein